VSGAQDPLFDDDAEHLHELAPCGFLTTKPDGTIINVNSTFLMLTGFQREDLVGRRRFADLLTGGGRIYHETHYAPMLSMHGRVREIALDIVCADGGRLPTLVNSVLERNAAGTPVLVRTAVFDATDRREYERELLRAKQRAEDSEARATALARTLQQTLIPPTPPHIPGLDVAALYRPAGSGEEVGGDFYDIFQVSGREWVVVIGDVCGKGVEAAVVTALVRHTLRALVVGHAGPGDALGILNDILLRHDTDRFCTVALLWLRCEDEAWTATASVGGHPMPLLLRPGSAPVALGIPGSLIGAFERPEFHDAELALVPGDSLVLYTDGVTEGRLGDEFFGDARMYDALTTNAAEPEGSAASMGSHLLEQVTTFQQGNPRDDIAIVVVQVPFSR
jgi:sigma-B regulation protein RsbU (phosphoserine phosphatase)